MKKQSLMLAVSLALFGLVGCSDALSQEDIAKLSLEEAAIEVCEAYASMDADRITAFLEEKYIQKTKDKLEKGLNFSAREALEQSICVVTDVEEKRRYTDVTNVDSDSETYHSVYFGGSKLDSVEIEWDDKKEQYFVISDAFKNDLKLY